MKKESNILRQRKERAKKKLESRSSENNYLITFLKSRYLAYPMKDLLGVLSTEDMPIPTYPKSILPPCFLSIIACDFSLIHLLNLSYFLEEDTIQDNPIEIAYAEVNSLLYGVPSYKPSEKKHILPHKISPTSSFSDFIEGIYGEEKRTIYVVNFKKLVHCIPSA